MASAEEIEEYMIAADLTLYANPLNVALLDGINSQSKKAEAAQKKPKDDCDTISSNKGKGKLARANTISHSIEDEEVIASDMTKYDSPMTALDISALNKELDEATKTEKDNKAETTPPVDHLEI